MDLSVLIKQTKSLPQIPNVVKEVLDTLQQPDASPSEIAQKLAMDQSLSLKVIRLANSPSFGAGRSIASVQEAAARLGISSLKTLVITSCITSSLKAPNTVDPSRFWHHSFISAGIAKWICQQSPLFIDQNLAYTCGIIHNMGAVVLALCYPREYQLIDEAVKHGGNRLELEQQQLGFDHADAGAALAEYWQLPNELVKAIRYQYQPDKAGAEKLLANVLHLSGFIYRIKFGEAGKKVNLAFPKATVEGLGLELTSLLKLSEETDFLDEDFQALVA